MKVLLIGANGQLAQDISRRLAADSKPTTLVPITHDQMDIREAARVREVISQARPQVVINTAAFHRVDDCEDQQELAFSVNEAGVRNVAEAAESCGARLVQFSTDYIFDGSKHTPYVETDEARPLSVYAKSRLAGERAVEQSCSRYMIVRTCGLYGLGGSRSKTGNFVETMLRLAAQHKKLNVVSDQICTPTATTDLALHLVPLMRSGAHGIFHMTNSGECSWFQFAKEIFRLGGVSADLSPITTAAYAAKAKRPAYSVLDNAALRATGAKDFRPWQEALGEYLHARSSSAAKPGH
jgi:dTDP-4-dehydrorhamnose reductase